MRRRRQHPDARSIVIAERLRRSSVGNLRDRSRSSVIAVTDAGIAVACALGGYVVGMFPSAVMVAKSRGVDITREGSGNPGASNVARLLGWRFGVAVFLLDGAKGTIAAGAGWALAGRSIGYIAGAAAIVGHMYPVL